MAGNLVSLFAASTKSRGGRQSEAIKYIKHFSKDHHKFTVCPNCNTVIDLKDYDSSLACPFCKSERVEVHHLDRRHMEGLSRGEENVKYGSRKNAKKTFREVSLAEVNDIGVCNQIVIRRRSEAVAE